MNITPCVAFAAEDKLSKLQCVLEGRSRVYELFKNHKWSLTSSRCGRRARAKPHPHSGAGALSWEAPNVSHVGRSGGLHSEL